MRNHFISYFDKEVNSMVIRAPCRAKLLKMAHIVNPHSTTNILAVGVDSIPLFHDNTGATKQKI